MDSPTTVDEKLVRDLPLPLAQLYLMAAYAKRPVDQLLHSLFLWEASVKLLASVAAVAYGATGRREPKIDALLAKSLPRPALGHWWELARELVKYLAPSDDRFANLKQFLLDGSVDQAPRMAALDDTLRKLDYIDTQQARYRTLMLFDHLVVLRNKEPGHGNLHARGQDFVGPLATALRDGVPEIVRRLLPDMLGGGRLVYISDVAADHGGGWQISRLELSDTWPRPLPTITAPQFAPQQLARAGELYLEIGPTDNFAEPPLWHALHPLFVYDTDRRELYYWNGDDDWLSHTSGDHLKRRREKKQGSSPEDASASEKRRNLKRAMTALVARLTGSAVDESGFDEQAAANRAADPGAPSPSPDDDDCWLGDFQKKSLLGEGGEAFVYRAWQPSLGREVALKQLKLLGNAKAETRFQREIQALGRVDHPHLVKTFSSGIDQGRMFYAMELVDGVDLGKTFNELSGQDPRLVTPETWCHALTTAYESSRGAEAPASRSTAPVEQAAAPATSVSSTAPPVAAPPPATQPHALSFGSPRDHVRAVVEAVCQAARAAQALHVKRIIHRDIKPGNIMLQRDGQAVLMDLGVAKFLDPEQGFSKTQGFVGTLRYASPEQLCDASRVDARSDVYSLGATLWELLALRPLFGATDQTPEFELRDLVRKDEPGSLRTINPHVPRDLAAIANKCLEKSEDRRYRTTAELADDLDRWLRGDFVTAQPHSLGYVLTKTVRRHLRPIAATAAVLLLAVIGTALAFWKINTINQQLAASLVREEAERKTAEEQHRLADEQRNLAIDSLSAMVFDVQEQMEGMPALHDLKRKILETALSKLKLVTNSLTGHDSRSDELTAAAQLKIADILLTLGSPSDASLLLKSARASLESAHANYVRLAKERPNDTQAQRELAASFDKLGDVSMRQGDFRDSRKYYNDGLDVRKRLADAEPGDVKAQRDLSISYDNLGRVSLQQGALVEAEKYFRLGLAIRKLLADADKADAEAQRNLSISYEKLGDTCVRQGNLHAQPLYQLGLLIRRQLADADKNNSQALYEVSMSCSKYGDLLMRNGALSDAQPLYQLGLLILQQRADANKSNAQAQSDVCTAYEKLGELYMRQGELRNSRMFYDRSLITRERLADADKKNAIVQRGLAVIHFKRGMIAEAQAEFAVAITEFRRHAIAVFDEMIAGGMFVEQSQQERTGLQHDIERVEKALATAARNKKADPAQDLQPGLDVGTKTPR